MYRSAFRVLQSQGRSRCRVQVFAVQRAHVWMHVWMDVCSCGAQPRCDLHCRQGAAGAGQLLGLLWACVCASALWKAPLICNVLQTVLPSSWQVKELLLAALGASLSNFWSQWGLSLWAQHGALCSAYGEKGLPVILLTQPQHSCRVWEGWGKLLPLPSRLENRSSSWDWNILAPKRHWTSQGNEGD